ncbi:hypothetical protein [Staphylococcus aureus]|uniref:hypothetical protein n=1 Tax=Staphylococcus aureus TaxID=1280 RepID=UPI0027FE00E8|nr:hypothetical protein [Staphylococcus aureus]MDQ7134568.1 hypothetical protein [Staphylococcus aureus]
MSNFSIKRLEASEPLNLYSDLNKSIEFGESYATSTFSNEKEGRFYFLGGLDVYELNTASLSEETIGRFSNALETGNIYYAVFPNDQRKGRLPLVLDKKTRAFLNTMPEIVNNDKINWYLFKLPSDIDPDNNERRGSEFVTDEDGQKVKFTFDEIGEQIGNYGQVKEQKNKVSVFMSEDEQEDEEDKEDKEDKGDKRDKVKAKEQYNNEDKEDKEKSQEKLNNEEKSDKEDKEHTNDERQKTEKQIDENNTETNNSVDSEFDEMMHDEGSLEESETDAIEDSDDFEKAMAETEGESNNQTLDYDLASISYKEEIDGKKPEHTDIGERTKKYVQLPSLVESIINDVSLPKFTDYPINKVHDVTSNTMQKEVNDSNARIVELEKKIKQEAKQLYRDYMYQSHQAITSELDKEKGNDVIRSAYAKHIEETEALYQQLDIEVEEKKNELEERFYGQAFEDYKNEINAQVRKWYEDARYEKDVSNPLSVFKAERKQDYEERKLDKASDFNEWLNTIEDTAIGQDQQKAIQHISKFIQNKVSDSMANIESLQRRMDQVNQSLAQIEYHERASENIRKSFGTDLKTDEQANAYKRKLDTALEDKADLDAAFKAFREKTKQQQKEMDASHKESLEELHENHSKVIEDLEHEKEMLSKDNQVKEAAAISAKKERDTHAKKTGFKFAGVATLATAIVVGGCSMITNYSNENDNNQKIEQQQKELKSTNEKLKEQSQKLEEKDQEIQKQKDIAKQEKEKAEKSKSKTKDKK